MAEGHSIVINVPIPRLCEKISKDLLPKMSIQNIINHIKEKPKQKPSDTTLQKYHLIDEKIPRSVSLQRDELLLPLKMFSKLRDITKNKQKLEINIYEKYKIRKTDLQKRLYVESPLDDVAAVADIDHGFYNYINGRPIRDHAPLFKSLKFAINDLTRIKSEIGYRNDTILNIDEIYKNELKSIDRCFERCVEQAKYFDGFISEDYRKSMSFLNKWEQLEIKLQAKKSELQNLASEQLAISSRLMGLDYSYTVQQKYGRFLYYLSPPSWRAQHRSFAQSIEIEAKGFDLGNSNIDDTFKTVYEKLQKECAEGFVKPALYFTHPNDLINIFESLEKQQLHIFAHVTNLKTPMKMVKDGINCLKDILRQESAAVADTINGLKKLLEFNEERCAQLKNRFFSVLNGLFFKSVGAPDVLKLLTHLEFCYERVYSEKPFITDIRAISKSLEILYLDYTKKLDRLHSNAVLRAISQCEEKERAKYKRAEVAARELRLFDRLEKELRRAYFTDSKCDKPLSTACRRSIRKIAVTPKCSKPDNKISAEKPLSDTELEYLLLFTDWIEGENPEKYIHRLDSGNQ